MNEKLTRLIGKVKLGARKNAPELLLGAAALTGIAGIVTVCKAAVKSSKVIDNYKASVESYHNDISEDYTEEEAKADTKKVTIATGIELVKTYAVPTALFATTGLLVFSAYNIQRKRNIALATELASVTAAYSTLIKKLRNGAENGLTAKEVLEGKEVIETVDEDGNVKKEIVQGTPVEDLYHFRFDKYSPNWETNHECNIYYINGVENWANDLLRVQGYVFLNDVLDRLGIPRTKAGQIVGWRSQGDGDGYIDFGVSDCALYENPKYDDNAFDLNFNVDGDILSTFK